MSESNEDLLPVFRDVSESSFSSTEELEVAVAEAFDRHREDFPRAFTYRDAIDCAREAGWIFIAEGRFELQIP